MIDWRWGLNMSNVFFLEINNDKFKDLYLCYCGLEECKSSYSFGPAIRPNYLIHYILKGKGVYYVNNKQYHINENQGFLINPNIVTFYQADIKDPWTYIWIGFDGEKAKEYLKFANLDEDNLIFTYDKDDSLKDYVLQMLKLHSLNYSSELKIEGLLYLFLSKLAESANIPYKSDNQTSNIYINKSIEFIQNNYHNYIKVSDIANYVSLNRSYLTTIFTESLGMSPQKFLMEFRMTKATELLYNTNLSVGDIARSCGYSDPLAFSKTFKKFRGISPKRYRNNKQKYIEQLHY